MEKFTKIGKKFKFEKKINKLGKVLEFDKTRNEMKKKTKWENQWKKTYMPLKKHREARLVRLISRSSVCHCSEDCF